MSLEPLLSASPVVQIHAFAAIAALVLAVFQLSLPKGNTRHRMLGYIWAAIMMAVALSSLWIHNTRMWGPFSPIHILSLITLVGVPSAIYAARKGNIQRHKYGMLQLIFFGLIGAGAFASFVPGRIMYQVFFGR